MLVFNAIFSNIAVISLWRKPEKTTDLAQVTDKHAYVLRHIFSNSKFMFPSILSVNYN